MLYGFVSVYALDSALSMIAIWDVMTGVLG